ncbi:ethanolamine ammonia-lyase subunit EutB [Hungatella sp.]|uniref:ethanolamine ammonia-lyase subunit EutB n=1 Tax=Hungatella sp. TaxID=2613924 RepID=UPI0039912EC0
MISGNGSSYEADNEAIHRISRGLTAEMVASVCKLMTNLDLIYAAQKIRVTAHCNTTVGARDIMGTRLPA